MNPVPGVQGRAGVRIGRPLVLANGGRSGRKDASELAVTDSPELHRPSGSTHRLGRELAGFLAAVFVGSVVGVLTGGAMEGLVSPATATNLALALGTTATAAGHARLVHRLGYHALVPRLLLAAPLAYAVMRAVHAVLGR